MVEVERSKSGEFWRMSYNGESEILDEEPSEQEKSRFVRSVNAQRARERAEEKLAAAGGHASEIQRVG